MVEGRILISGIMLVIFATMVAMASTYPSEARFLPLVIGVPGLVLCIIQFMVELRGKPGEDEKVYSAETRQAELKMFGWFAVFVFGIILFGFPYAAPLIIALYLHFSWDERWYVSLGAAAFAFAVLHGIFNYVLGLPLFEGLVYQWIYG
jgi:hypothetical protein